MKKYLVKEYNVLLKDNKKYKAVDLAKDMEISRQSAGVHIAKLKALNLLGEIETNKGRLFCLNPYYYLRGEKASEQVVKLFDDNVKKNKKAERTTED
jgi:predicted ArsR family transcriptional regulator